MSDYQPVFDGLHMTCPYCNGSGRILDSNDPTGTNICSLCHKTGLVTPKVARKHLLGLSDYDGMEQVDDAVYAWLMAHQAERDHALPADNPRRRGKERMYR